VRIGLRLPPCMPVPELAAMCAQAEDLGFDSVWFPDSQLLWRDVWVVAAAAAQATTRLGIGIAVTNVETRHPSVTASAMRSVAEVAPGRLRTGFGTGNSSLGLLGIPPTPRATLESRLTQIRALVTGADSELGAGVGRLRDPCGALPIYIAASGPRNLRFAGGHADGVILLSGVSLPLVERALTTVHDGARSAGRSIGDVPVIVSAFAHVTDDVERDARVLKPLCAALAIGGATEALAAEGIDVQPPPMRPTGVYPDLVHAEDWTAAIAAVEEFVTDDAAVRFAERFCLFGTLDVIYERLRDIESAGVSEVLVQHVGSYDLPLQLAHDLTPLLGRRTAAVGCIS